MLTIEPQPTAEPVRLRLEALEPDPENGAVDLSSPLAGWPVAGEITQGFGCSGYYTGLPGPDCPAEAPWFHDGIDIGPPAAGAPVRAALTGTVIFAGPDGSGPDCGQGYRGYGLAVVVGTETGWLALYGHLARVDVAAGQAVTPETVIGTVGETGCVSGPHLHFGLQHHNELIDPEEMRR
jgi:murein DD-endopeptidase MepM/ murein hydrolase activator NlpD